MTYYTLFQRFDQTDRQTAKSRN